MQGKSVFGYKVFGPGWLCEIYRKEQRRPCQHTGKGNPYRQIVGIRQ